jgi:1-phosphatidylinositol-3-phosphate 5-kinase
VNADFLGKVNVMDYSLLVGIDTSTNEIIVGIVDYLRRYTLDKHIESWVKLLGAAGEKPTVISPPQYASRFREGIESYFTTVPYNF